MADSHDDVEILPPGWRAYVDEETGRTFYHHFMGATQWEIPRWHMDAGGGGGAAVYSPPPQLMDDDEDVGLLYSPHGRPSDGAAACGWGDLDEAAADGVPMWLHSLQQLSAQPFVPFDDFDFDRDIVPLFPDIFAAAAAPGLAAAAPGPATVMPADVARYVIAHPPDQCPISWLDLKTRPMDQRAVTSCGHVFDKDSIMQVKDSNGVCPKCRSEFVINPIREADVVGRPTFVPRHLKMPLVIRAFHQWKVPIHLNKENKISESAYHMCNVCGNVVDKIPVPNECPKCKNIGAFSGGSRKHKRNIHRKSKRLIKRKKTMKRR
jgi:predicted Zn-ribbon and HTH transcriptional regulator